jgi:hypothetical protein
MNAERMANNKLQSMSTDVVMTLFTDTTLGGAYKSTENHKRI